MVLFSEIADVLLIGKKWIDVGHCLDAKASLIWLTETHLISWCGSAESLAGPRIVTGWAGQQARRVIGEQHHLHLSLQAGFLRRDKPWKDCDRPSRERNATLRLYSFSLKGPFPFRRERSFLIPQRNLSSAQLCKHPKTCFWQLLFLRAISTTLKKTKKSVPDQPITSVAAYH